MKSHIACAAQCPIELLAVERNLATCLDAISAAAAREADLVVLPELANVGFVHGYEPRFMRDYYEAADRFQGPFVTALAGAASDHRIHAVVGLAMRHPTLTGVLCNTVVLIRPDGEIFTRWKSHLPREEKHYFFAGDRLEPIDTTLGRIGMLVCADNSFPEAARELALTGAEIIAVPYCAQRLTNTQLYPCLAAVRAYENQVFVIAANRVGEQGELSFGGHSTIAAPDGTLLATLGDTKGLAVAEIDASLLIGERLRQTRFRDRRPQLYRHLVLAGESP